MQNPLRTYQLVAGATGAMLTEKIIFVISHDDEQNQCAVSIIWRPYYVRALTHCIMVISLQFTLSVMSRQRGSVSVIQVHIHVHACNDYSIHACACMEL